LPSEEGKIFGHQPDTDGALPVDVDFLRHA
jgi:hypothetical protein